MKIVIYTLYEMLMTLIRADFQEKKASWIFLEKIVKLFIVVKLLEILSR